jgi:hypothetical protein
VHSRQSLGGHFQSHAPHEPLESGGLQRGAPALPGAAVRREEPTQRGPSCLSASVRCRHSLQEESSCRSGTLYRSRAEPRRAADCLQRSLRSRFRQQLTPSVAMTSHVKSWSQLFQVIMMLLSSVHRKRRSQEDPTVDHAAIRGLGPTLLVSVGCLPRSRHAGFLPPLHASEDCTKPRLLLLRMV